MIHRRRILKIGTLGLGSMMITPKCLHHIKALFPAAKKLLQAKSHW